MTKMGFMMPNTEWENWTTADMNVVSHIKPTCILVPLYDVHNPFFATRLQIMQQIRALLPNCTFLWRMMQDKPTLQDPAWWAGECNNRIAAMHAYLSENSHIIPWNEANIEGSGENWTALVAWINTFMGVINKRNSYIHLPALSPSGNYKAGIAALKAVSHLFDASDVHIYNQNQEADATLIQQSYNLSTWVTEFNRLLPSALAANVPASVVGVIWFILRGTPDQAQYNLVEPYYSDMVNYLLNPPVPPQPIPPMPLPLHYTIGIDLSSNNGLINGSLLAESGMRFAIVKVTEGTNYVNTLLASQRSAVLAAGLELAYYHFAQPDLNADPMAEVHYFIANLPDKDHPIALDLETGSGPLQAWATIWLQGAAQLLGRRPWFYSGAWFMYPHLLHDNTDLNKFDLWLAHPDPTQWPDPIPAWDRVAINQYGAGNVLGIAGSVDLDAFDGTIEQFRNYGKS